MTAPKHITLETKAPSLIGKGFIDPTDPQQLPIAVEDIAALLEVSPADIEAESIQRWPHMLRVRLKSGRYTCVSYRSLPGWTIAGEKAIARCTSTEQLNHFAEQVRGEKKRFQKRYCAETLAKWRALWKIQRDRLRQLEARRTEAESWKQGWVQISTYCTDIGIFNQLVEEWRRQCPYFADLPEIISETEQILRQRWVQLGEAS